MFVAPQKTVSKRLRGRHHRILQQSGHENGSKYIWCDAIIHREEWLRHS
jgi:hypothetical protein